MRTPLVAARLMRGMDEIHAYWECAHERRDCPCEGDTEEIALIYATLMLAVFEGIDRLELAILQDRQRLKPTLESVL